MLRKLRNKKTAKWIFLILLIIILPAFVFWGFGSYLRSRQEATLRGRIDGRNISELEYRDALEAVRTQAIMQFGDRLGEVAKFLNLQTMAVERILLLSEVKKRHLRASDKEVVETIQGYPIFEINNQFNNKYYLETLQYVFHTQARVFEEHTRQNIMISKLYQNITDKVTLSEEEIREEYLKANAEVSLYYIASRLADFAKDIPTDAEKLKTYFQENRLQFKQPLSFNLEYVTVGKDTEDENSIREKIKKLLPQLKSGQDINKIARELGSEPKETGFFSLPGPIPGLGWSPQLADLISQAKLRQYLPPVQIDKTYYLVRLKEKREAYLPKLEEIKDKVQLAFVRDAAYQLARAKIEACLEKLKENPQAADFDKAAKAFNLKSGATQPFKYGSYIEGIGGSDIFWTQAQNLKENEFSAVVEVPSGFYIIRVKSKNPIDENKFKAEKEDFSQKLLAQKKQEIFAGFIGELKKIHQLD